MSESVPDITLSTRGAIEIRDRQLARWRTPGSDYVVYPQDPDHVLVLSEQTGRSYTFERSTVESHLSEYARVAALYFNAHPLDPGDDERPWLSALDGEVWMIRTVRGVMVGLPYRDDVGRLRFAAARAMVGIDSSNVIGGERLHIMTEAEYLDQQEAKR